MADREYYTYKGQRYWIVGGCKSKNSVTRKWEDHIMYHSVEYPHEPFTREVNDFRKKFIPEKQ